MDYPKFVDLENIHLGFKAIPIKNNWQLSWELLQKASKSLSFKEGDSVGMIINGISQLINNFSADEIETIINKHLPFIYVLENGKENPLNIDYHFNGKPYLVLTLLVKIIEVYYKSFFIELLKSLNLMGIIQKAKKDSAEK